MEQAKQGVDPKASKLLLHLTWDSADGTGPVTVQGDANSILEVVLLVGSEAGELRSMLAKRLAAAALPPPAENPRRRFKSYIPGSLPLRALEALNTRPGEVFRVAQVQEILGGSITSTRVSHALRHACAEGSAEWVGQGKYRALRPAPTNLVKRSGRSTS